VVDLDPLRGEEFLQVPTGQSVPQLPAHRKKDYFGRNRKPVNAELGWSIGRMSR
jgi:hypothetical protein